MNKQIQKEDLTLLNGKEIDSRIRILRMKAGHSYEEAKEQAQPLLDELNRRKRVIAKKYKKRFFKIQFAGYPIV